MVKKNMYAPTGWASIICGAITVAAGLILAICRWREQAIAYVLTGVVVVNALLHAACYHHSLQVRPNGSILTICIVELFLSVILPLENNWQSVYGLYLVMNGASLVAIPLKMSRTFGVVAIFSGIITYIQPIIFPESTAVIMGIGLFINGGERTIMALKSGRVNRNETK